MSASAWSRSIGRTAPTVVLPLVGLALASVAAHLVLFPAPGLVGDIDQFVLWTHGIAVNGVSTAYDQNVSFPPVMVYVWSLLASVAPAVATATSSADVAVRAVMKLPATLADLGLAAGVGWYLRDRPRWAVLGFAAIAFNPVVLYVSAWWGQYESIYALAGLVAFLLAVRGHRDAAAVALAVAVMTKPQALPFVVPFAAWYLARFGVLGLARGAAIGVAAIVVLWLPFLASGGPAHYAENLATYQGDVFSVLSLRAWNPWWILQSTAGGDFASDSTPVLGPVTFRLLGYAMAAILELVVFLAVLRDPSARRLALGLAAATLVAFMTLTTMHERYAFAAVVFLALLLREAPARAVWLVLTTVLFANLVAAAPPVQEVAAVLPIDGPLGIIGALVLLVLTGTVVALLFRANPGSAQPELEPH